MNIKMIFLSLIFLSVSISSAKGEMVTIPIAVSISVTEPSLYNRVTAVTFVPLRVDIPESELDVTCSEIGNNSAYQCYYMTHFQIQNFFQNRYNYSGDLVNSSGTVRMMLSNAANKLVGTITEKGSWVDAGNCVANFIGMYRPTNLDLPATIQQGSNNPTLLPVLSRTIAQYSYCTAVVPPVNEWCAFENIDIDMDYGNKTADSIVGAEVSRDLQIYCTNKNKIRLLLNNGTDVIPLSNGMKAKITVDKSELGREVNLEDGMNHKTITSTLQGEVQGGAFEGSSVLYMVFN